MAHFAKIFNLSDEDQVLNERFNAYMIGGYESIEVIIPEE